MGTVINSKSGVVSSELNDFYMVGHRALQGTSKPLRYILLKEGFADEKGGDLKVPDDFVTTESWWLKYFRERSSRSYS